ncbi:MAG: DUF3141 domain-containing protein [Alphaproteobacteria bacterium]|nr:DUF3141 domain-containing protein [Alphaproteobacteria bacterium]
MPWLGQAFDYMIDAWQRGILMGDLLRQRGNNQLRTLVNPAPNVLNFDYTLMIDGRDLKPAVNYMLLRIEPPAGSHTDPAKRPFVVFDPRAGHGPGIGGMKKDSEVGMALAQGHPVYFVSFLPAPVACQTVEDVWRAEAYFVEQIISWHPQAKKPCLIGNCQAGWQIAMMSASQPHLSGVLILAGTPFSYWAGVHGKYPMRYMGGMTMGSWVVALACDLGGGMFDGAYLVDNFEKNDPANTYWSKHYNVYSQVDTASTRFLAFERWWSNPTLLSRQEILFIVDELFVGNHLTKGKIYTSDGARIDLRHIKAPLVLFCSRGDEITPPQQALGWILDLYKDEKDLIAQGKTIIYAMHPSIGHLGLFVASAAINKEHRKFISSLDMIDGLGAGLYEAVFEDHASDDIILRFEPRRFDDLRTLGGNSADDDRCFEAAALLSENMKGLYDGFVSPFVRPFINKPMADIMRALHPRRLQVLSLSDNNPMVAPFGIWAAFVRQTRRPVPVDNIFLAMQQLMSEHIVYFWDDVNEKKNALVENLFFAFYGNPLLQAVLGLQAREADMKREDFIP